MTRLSDALDAAGTMRSQLFTLQEQIAMGDCIVCKHSPHKDETCWRTVVQFGSSEPCSCVHYRPMPDLRPRSRDELVELLTLFDPPDAIAWIVFAFNVERVVVEDPLTLALEDIEREPLAADGFLPVFKRKEDAQLYSRGRWPLMGIKALKNDDEGVTQS